MQVGASDVTTVVFNAMVEAPMLLSEVRGLFNATGTLTVQVGRGW